MIWIDQQHRVALYFLCYIRSHTTNIMVFLKRLAGITIIGIES